MESLHRQEIVTMPISQEAKAKLLSHGYNTIADLEKTNLHELTMDLGLTTSDALEVLRTDRNTVDAVLAGDLYSMECHHKQIPTLAPDLDEALGGGLHLGRVIEFCGVPGIGKTQLMIQLCVNVTIPRELNGVGGSAVFIGMFDTEGSFVAERAVDMSIGLQSYFHSMARNSLDAAVHEKVRECSVDDILNQIHYFRVLNCEQQVALMKRLPFFVQQHPNIRLVVFDSICFLFRHGFKNDMSLRTRLLCSLAQDMMSLAESYNIAVVYTNQVMQRIYENGEVDLVAALGDTWSQCVNTRVRLYQKGSHRVAFVHKAPDLPQREVHYDITQDGIRNAVQ